MTDDRRGGTLTQGRPREVSRVRHLGAQCHCHPLSHACHRSVTVTSLANQEPLPIKQAAWPLNVTDKYGDSAGEIEIVLTHFTLSQKGEK